ncbi:MAG: NPCBM/NEW2 domain-containing protein [Victivallales bacterium]|nr:NPCBM/NEW2 domain-containing protein [Victivallales bacterium]
MKRAFLLILLAICGSLLAGPTDGWEEACAKALKEMDALSANAWKPLDAKLKVKRAEEPVTLTADVTGLDELWLIVDDGGDGNGCDHSCWVNPVFTKADGTTVSGIKATIKSSWAQWDKVRINKNEINQKLNIAGKDYDEGWFAHANSYICLELDKQYTKFTVIAGCDKNANTAPDWRMGYSLYAVRPATWVAMEGWNKLNEQFPQVAGWINQDLHIGGGHRFVIENRKNLSARLIPVIKELAAKQGRSGRRFATKLEALQADEKTAQFEYMKLYVTVREALTSMSEIDGILALAERTLDYVSKATPMDGYAEKLAAYREQIEAKRNAEGKGDWTMLGKELRALRREILFKHPALAFNDLLINKQPPTTYSHMVDQYLGRRSRPGAGLVVLHDWKSAKPREEVLLEGKLPLGSVAHPDLSYDGKKILFSYCDHSEKDANRRRFFIYEIGVDGSGLRQITGTKDDPMTRVGNRNTVLIEDFDPCYLPDGGIAFVSTRCQSFGRCHGGRYTPAYFLYRMDGDGKNIRPLSYGEANEWDPSVLPDGRLIYTRWDYINRHDTIYQSLWTMRPDGTGTAHFYGNYTRNPYMIAEARLIPGSDKIIATAMAHHSYTAGSIIHIDQKLGEDGPEPITRITPEERFPEGEGRTEHPFASPWPLNPELTLVARSEEPIVFEGGVQSVNAYRIWLIDTMGGREEIYVDPNMSCICPIPIQSRPMPPNLCSALATANSDKPGLVYIQNANIGRMDFGAKVKALRVNSIICQPTASVPSRSVADNEITKKVEGTVPVREDGSAFFHLPSGKPLQLQALDETGQAIMTMRSFIYVQGGELLSCVGCHENRSQTAPARPMSMKQPDEIKPVPGTEYAGGFSYVRSVQPVWDRYCISCHGFGKATEKLDLRGIMDQRRPIRTPYSHSYMNIMRVPGSIRLAQRNQETGSSVPRDYFSHASNLMKKLMKGHCKPLLEDKDSLNLVITWLDLNVQYFGDYSFSRGEGSQIDADGEKALREAIAKRFGEELSKQPFDTLVNVVNIPASRILNIALPVEQGGWGQITEHAFTSKEDPEWREFAKLVWESVKRPADAPDDGTCGLQRCVCGVCWVKHVQKTASR